MKFSELESIMYSRGVSSLADIARALKAECTPEFYLYDNSDRLVYRGRMDNSSPGNDIEISGNDLREACSNLLNGSVISSEQHPSMGCNIKWK